MNKINIRFIIALNRLNKRGETSLGCRITYLKIRRQLSTGLFINPKHWNSKKQKVLAEAENYEYTNTQLSLIKTKINQAFLMLQIQATDFTVEDIYALYKGEKLTTEYNVIEYFERYLNKLKRLIGVEIKQITWNKSYYVKNNIKSFIKWKFNCSIEILIVFSILTESFVVF